MESYPAKFKSFQRKIVQMGVSQMLQNSIQTLLFLWLVYPIHTNFLFKVIFEESAFYHFPTLNTSVLCKDSQILLIFHLNVLVFQRNGKQPYSFPVLSRFCNWLLRQTGSNVDTRHCRAEIATLITSHTLLLFTNQVKFYLQKAFSKQRQSHGI